MTKVEFHTEAQSELEDAHAWYRERSEFAARAFAAEIDYAIKIYRGHQAPGLKLGPMNTAFCSEGFHIRLSIASVRMKSSSLRLLIKSDDLGIGGGVN